MAVIEVNGLQKRYGEHLAVADVSFEVQEGEIFGVLGPNGAGKTTTVECIEGLRVPDGGTIRKLWMGETDVYRDHLLRLDPASRHTRFSGTVSDDAIAGHAATAGAVGVVVHGFFVDGILRGASELRRIGPVLSREAEAAFSIERPWQSHGVGTVLLERTLLSARNRGIISLHMHCLAHNHRMQQLARKFEAGLSFDFGSVVGAVDPPRLTVLSLMREWMADTQSVGNAILDMQERFLRPA